MIKNKNLIYGIILMFFIVVFGIFIWNYKKIEVHESPDNQITLPTETLGECGIENCHGLDITCGQNVPEFCSDIYRAGDNCRQFVSCQTIEGQCKLDRSSRFDSCKTCVEKCEQEYPNDQIKFFECESSCAE